MGLNMQSTGSIYSFLYRLMPEICEFVAEEGIVMQEMRLLDYDIFRYRALYNQIDIAFSQFLYA